MALMGLNPPSPLGMSDIPVSQDNPNGGSMESGGGNGGPKLVFRAVQALKAIAAAYPDISKDVDQAIQLVEKLGMSVIAGGPQGQTSPGMITNSGDMGGIGTY